MRRCRKAREGRTARHGKRRCRKAREERCRKEREAMKLHGKDGKGQGKRTAKDEEGRAECSNLVYTYDSVGDCIDGEGRNGFQSEFLCDVLAMGHYGG